MAVACRVCGGPLEQFLDLGRQPPSDAFLLTSEDVEQEFFFRLAVGRCTACDMVQLLEEVPRDRMFREDYPYHSSGSQLMRAHFADTARELIRTELTREGAFCVEIGSNDGVMLRTIRDAGIRHLGFEPSGGVARLAQAGGVRVRTEFFEESTAVELHAAEGPADVIYAANTFCHIPYITSILRGVDVLLADDGVFVFEDPYLGDIVAKTSFDQIYDEHFFLFTARSVQAMARRFGMELVDVKRLPVHGGEVRYTLARAGRRTPSEAVGRLLAMEHSQGLTEQRTLDRFARNVQLVRSELTALLHDLKARKQTVAAYGATAKSATITNYCGLGPDLIDYVCDNTPAKHDRLTPGTHIPVRSSERFSPDYPDYALLFAWNHAEEIMAKERAFSDQGGRWIFYVPKVHVI